MRNMQTMLSSKDMDWETPKELFDNLDKEFRFTLDPCQKNRQTDENIIIVQTKNYERRNI